MRILRTDRVIHSFKEKPTESDIHFGYVTIVRDEEGHTYDHLYSVEGGWNTTGKDDTEYAISAEKMAVAYEGWVSKRDISIISNAEEWFTKLNDLIEDVELKRRTDPQEYETESEQEWWNALDELYSALLNAKDFAEVVA